MEKKNLDKYISNVLKDMTKLPSYRIVIDALNTPDIDWLKDDDHYLEYYRLGRLWDQLTKAQIDLYRSPESPYFTSNAVEFLTAAAEEWDLMADGTAFYTPSIDFANDGFVDSMDASIKELAERAMRLVYTQKPKDVAINEEQ